LKDTEVTAGLAESTGSLLPGLWRDSLHVTCGLTACTPGSAPGTTLGNEYGKTLPLPFTPQGGMYGGTRCSPVGKSPACSGARLKRSGVFVVNGNDDGRCRKLSAGGRLGPGRPPLRLAAVRLLATCGKKISPCGRLGANLRSAPLPLLPRAPRMRRPSDADPQRFPAIHVRYID